MRGFSRRPGALAASDRLKASNAGGRAPDLRGGQEVRRHRVDDHAVLDREAEPVRRFGAVVQDPPASVGGPHQVRGIDVQPASRRRRQPVAPAQEGRVRVQPVRGQHAAAYQPPRAVEVAQHGVEQPCALGDRAFQTGPLLAVEHAGEQVERPGTLPRASAPADVERGVAVAYQPAGLLRPPADSPAGRRPRRRSPPPANARGQRRPARPSRRSGRRAGRSPRPTGRFRGAGQSISA